MIASSIIRVLALSLSIAFYPVAAQAAFPWAYTWSPRAYNPFPGCGNVSGFSGPLCETAQTSCDSVKTLYSSPYGNLTIYTYLSSSGEIQNRWRCNYNYVFPRVNPINPICPPGYDSNIFTTKGCVLPPFPKTFGKRCDVSVPMAGNPVTICSGNKYQEKTDFQTSGKDILAFSRSYNSMSARPKKFGVGWQHNFERSFALLGSTASKRTALRPDGQELPFRLSGGVWIPENNDITITVAISGAEFLLKNEENETERYNSDGKLLSIEARDGYTQTLTYDPTSENLSGVSDNLGRVISFTYNADNLLDTLTDTDGKIYNYAYALAYPGTTAVFKKLMSVTYPDSTPSPTDNPVITYLYEDTNYPIYLTGITDEMGNRFATWTYNDDGQAINSEHAGGANETGIAFNSDGTKTATFPLGGQIKYTFSTIQGGPKLTREDRLATGSIPAANQQYTYDSRGFLSSMIDWKGNTNKYTFNTRGLETSRTEAFGTAQARTITTAWSTTYRLPTQIVRPGQTVDFTYDANGNLLTRTETDTTTHTIPYSTNGATRTWTYTYDSLGNVLTADGPRTDVTDTTTYTYDPTSKYLATVTDALNHITQITSYNNRGLPLSVTDPNGVVTDLIYDDLGRLKSRTVNAAGGDAVTAYDYDLAGLLTTITLPDNSTLNYEYDDAQRLKAVENDSGERIEYTLDAAGNITQENVKASGGGLRYKQAHEFDEISRLTKTIGATPYQDTAYAYDANGNRTSVTDPRNNTTAYAFDALNRLITVTDPLTHSATTGYDARDNITSQGDFRSLTTNYVYDGFNRVIQTASPDSGTTVYTLDKAGNRTGETDARSIVTNRTFDALNRVLTETYPASSSENMAYSYDSTSGGNFGIGRLTGFTDESGNTSYVYDERGNILTQISVIGSQTYTTGYEYDLADRVTYIAYPSGRRVKYTYDSHGDLTTVETKASLLGIYSSVASSIVHEAFGPLKSLIFGNGLVLTNSYDQNYWLSGTVSQDGATHIQDIAYGYDDAGNLTYVTDNLDNPRNQSFMIDSLNRISQAVGAYGTVGYTYDNNGNRLTRAKGGVTQTSTYPGGSNRLASINDGTNTRAFIYTASGNTGADDRATGPDVTFTYGARNRLGSVSVGGAAAGTYKINALGQRARKVAGPDTTDFLYDTDGHLIAEMDGSTGSVVRDNIWLNATPLAQVNASGDISFIHTDNLGTPQKMTDNAQALVWDRQQEPFGEEYASSGTATNLLRFPGQFRDNESSLNYNMMRDYDPTLGRYIEADPIGLNGGLNIYGYAAQNPVLFIDPNGSTAIPAGGFIIGAGILAAIYQPAILNMIEQMSAPSDEAREETDSVWRDICTASSPAGPEEPNENEEQRCAKVLRNCQEVCAEVFSEAPSSLPGMGKDFFSRNRACIRKCMQAQNCNNY